MALVNMKDLLQHAYANRYAVGAFEIVSLDFLQAVLSAAEKARSPVILNLVATHRELYAAELLLTATLTAGRRATVPVAIHMDHCTSAEAVQSAIRLGCNSVMFDAASQSFPVNVQQTQQVVKMAHACGIPVEGELGYVASAMVRASDTADDAIVYTSVDEAKEYVERTGVDFLAVSIGTIHGRARHKARLDFSRLARINESVGIPLVIHGGSGLSEDQYHKLIANGVARINYFTALAELAVTQLKTNLAAGEIPYTQLYAGLQDTLRAEIQHCMQIWGSAGRAAEVLMQCQPWQNVEHVIVYNMASDDPAVIQEVLQRGQHDLSRIPGVLDVQIGTTISAQNKYAYCWLIRFAHAAVIESYKQHPLHVAYADEVFRPQAADRITNDFEIIESPPLAVPSSAAVEKRAAPKKFEAVVDNTPAAANNSKTR